MVKKHTKRCSKSLVVREIHFKTTVKYHCIPTMMARIKISVGEDVEKLELSYFAGRNVKWYSNFEKLFGNSSKNQTVTS